MRRLYIVSFGNSRQYRIEFDDVKNEADQFHHTNPLEEAEKEIAAYLKEKFPNQPVAYFSTPKVVEVPVGHRDQFMHYPLFTAEAVGQIEKELFREVQVTEAMDKESSDAPYSDIDFNAE